jgi:hypothetical protein
MICPSFARRILLGVLLASVAAARVQAINPDEARAIVRDAYVYGFPLVDNYRVQYAYFVDATDPEFKGVWNEVHSTAGVYTPEDKAVQTPNSDTPYSMVGADLRAEPLVVTVPAVEPDRYYSIQFVDMYTFNFAYVGSRTTGNGAGRYLLAGPRWKGTKPPGVKAVFRSETEFASLIFRTQLFGPNDLPNVEKVQAGYDVKPLSEFLKKPAPKDVPVVDFVTPLEADEERTSLGFFPILNFVLGFCPTNPSETQLMARFARLNIGAGRTFDADALDPPIRQAVADGMKDAWAVLADVEAKVQAGRISSGDLFGTRQRLGNDYARRMAGAVLGIYGNTKEEAIYPAYAVDAAGQPLDGAGRYTLRFAPGGLPPVRAFWSLTMYQLPSRLLVANSLGRYLINSPMLPSLKRDADGGITIYVQRESPGPGREANWLPAPAGPFFMVMRLYWPQPDALDGRWKAPPLVENAPTS